mmetsp:Transcript_20702/g.58931  ORF Transcript_20702/g.58931 Transcript_20702/m.58931 type:complete len:343 (-) Transcript_20702:59-1087(-)
MSSLPFETPLRPSQKRLNCARFCASCTARARPSPSKYSSEATPVWLCPLLKRLSSANIASNGARMSTTAPLKRGKTRGFPIFHIGKWDLTSEVRGSCGARSSPRKPWLVASFLSSYSEPVNRRVPARMMVRAQVLPEPGKLTRKSLAIASCSVKKSFLVLQTCGMHGMPSASSRWRAELAKSRSWRRMRTSFALCRAWKASRNHRWPIVSRSTPKPSISCKYRFESLPLSKPWPFSSFAQPGSILGSGDGIWISFPLMVNRCTWFVGGWVGGRVGVAASLLDEDDDLRLEELLLPRPLELLLLLLLLSLLPPLPLLLAPLERRRCLRRRFLAMRAASASSSS